MQAALVPASSVDRDPALVQIASDLLEAQTAPGHLEDLLDKRRRLRVDNEGGPFLRTVLNLDSLVTIRSLRGEEESARCRLAHAARDLLGEVLGVELVDRFDDRFHQFAGRRVVGVFGDRSDPDPAPAQHRLERDGVLALASEAREFPDQDLLKGSVSPARRIQHLTELGPVGNAATLRLIDELTHYDIAVSLGVVAERAKLR